MEIPYLDYLGLSEKPFGLTPDTDFYFESETHKEALEHLKFFLGQGEGIALIYGEVGSGKTILSRMFLNSLDKSVYNTALILNPIMGEEEFIKEIMVELGIPQEDPSKKNLLDNLSNFLIDEHKKGRDTILVIDESQVLSARLLELIRILSNIETEKEKIIHTVLFAQTEFMDILHKPEMKNLSQRITVVYKLKSFSEKETRAYITFRLYKAGSKGSLHFSDAAVQIIHKTSQGCPRLINMICDRCLLVLYSQSKNIVSEQIVESVLSDESILFLKQTRPDMKNMKRRFFMPGIIILLLLIFVALFLFNDNVHKVLTLPFKKSSQPKTVVAAKAPEDAKATEQPKPAIAKPVIYSPYYLVSADSGEYALICEKDTKKLHLYISENNNFKLLKSFPLILGKIHSHSNNLKDPSIPEGIFFLTRFMQVPGIRDVYGYGAFVLNYPNPITFKKDRNEGWLWLHGHLKNKNLGEDLKDTKLGIAIENDAVKEIRSLVKTNGTPITIVEKIEQVDRSTHDVLQKEVQLFIDSWKNAWENLQIEKYLGYYSKDFLNSQKMNWDTYKQIKKNVNKNKKFIRITIEKPFLLLYPKQAGNLAVVRFIQKYSSDNFSDESIKVLYMQKYGSEWKIIGEDTIPM